MNINQIIEKFKKDAAFAAKYSALKSVEAILEQAKADGFVVTAEDIQAAISQLGTQSGELSEAELSAVAGGKGGEDRPVDPCPKCKKFNAKNEGRARPFGNNWRCRECDTTWVSAKQ